MSSASSSRPTSPAPSDLLSQHTTPHLTQAFRVNWDSSVKRGPASVFSEGNDSRLDLSSSINDFAGTYALGAPSISDPTYPEGLSPSSFSPEWSSSTQGFNAISTVLNNPRSKSVPLKSGKAPLPSAVSSQLPRVRRRDFDAYLNTIGPQWAKFERNLRGEEEDGDWDDEDSSTTLRDGLRKKKKQRANQPPPPLSTIPPLFFDPNFNLGHPRTFLAITELAPEPSSLHTPHATIPSEDISLNQPLQEMLSHYMDTVEQHLALEIQSRSSSFFAALTNMQDLQTEGAECLERISTLRGKLQDVDNNIALKGLNIVRLERRIENMKTLGGAVTNVKEIRDLLAMCERLVNDESWDEALSLVGVLEEFCFPTPPRVEVAISPIVSPVVRSSSSQALLSPTLAIEDYQQFLPPPSPTNNRSTSPFNQHRHRSPSPVFKPRPPSQLYLRTPPRSRSNSFMDEHHGLQSPPRQTTSRPTSPHPLSRPTSPRPISRPTSPRPTLSYPRAPEPPLSNKAPTSALRTLDAFATLPERVRALQARISETLCRTMINLLREDLSSRSLAPTDGVPPASGGPDQLRQRLVPVWQGLIKMNGIEEAVGLYRTMCLGEVRASIRRVLPRKADVEDEETQGLSEKSATLAEDLRAMEHGTFVSLSKSMYASLLSCLEGVVHHAKLFVSIADDGSSQLTDGARQALDSIVSEILPAATELANTRLSKVVLARAEQHSVLELGAFLELFNITWDFVVRCEVMARKMIVSLRGVMVSQAKAFLTNFHAARVSKAANLVENEVWAQVEVPSVAQRWADVIVDAAMSNPPELLLVPSSSSANPAASASTDRGPSSTVDPPSTSSSSAPAPPSTTKSAKQLLVDGRPYFVVGATLKVVQMLLDYLRLIANLSLLTTDTMSRTIEYLKSFNSRTCQVVLGAGAMRSAGLKNITAKHLALASQSLSAMIAFIPYVRETFRRHLNPKQAVMLIEFDKLKQDYHEHQNEIHSKLIAIMGDRLTAHCKSLNAIDWSVPPTNGGPNSYMEMLIKETLTLHKVLSKYLSAQAVEFIMTQVYAAINHRLSEEYTNMPLPSQEAKDRLLADARYLHSKLSAGFKDIGVPINTMLETVVKERGVPLRPSPFNNPNRRKSSMMTTPGMTSPTTATTISTPTPSSTPGPSGMTTGDESGPPPPPPDKPAFREVREEEPPSTPAKDSEGS